MAASSHADCAPWASGTSLPQPGSPWQNGIVERLIGSIQRECVDHIIVLGETHLRRVVKSYADYYRRPLKSRP
jgi:transposase InsO family protein